MRLTFSISNVVFKLAKQRGAEDQICGTWITQNVAPEHARIHKHNIVLRQETHETPDTQGRLWPCHCLSPFCSPLLPFSFSPSLLCLSLSLLLSHPLCFSPFPLSFFILIFPIIADSTCLSGVLITVVWRRFLSHVWLCGASLAPPALRRCFRRTEAAPQRRGVL